MEQNELQKEIQRLQKTISYLEERERDLHSTNKRLERQFNELIEKKRDEIVSIAFDGFMANKMLDAAAHWEAENVAAKDTALVEKINSIEITDKDSSTVEDYLVEMIQELRPNYDKETIINIAICITQGFLTIFYGEPGCGKTSFCRIFAEVLGLNKIAEVVGDARAGRYISVSVEKGWTSKRDLVGYYNPLSKTFDKSNRRIYDALRILDIEKRKGIAKLPFIILLDEANLSPLEYYWSDFMNLCDGADKNSSVNLGEDFVFSIPETLRFLATINSDHTTEELSPRLIDRAWIITLPESSTKDFLVDEEFLDRDIEIVSWQALRDTFYPLAVSLRYFPADIYAAVVDKFKDVHISISPRVTKAIQRYWETAAEFFDGTLALDYAIAQRLLPKIQGSGDDFLEWLQNLQRFFSNNKLAKSEKIISRIIARGNENMGYYRFFA